MRTVRARPAFTLLEMLVAMSLTLMIFAAAVPFFRVQLRSLSRNAGRLDAQQNIRFALASIQRELRVAGGGVVDAQPMIVQAAANAITFNVDLVTKDSSDPGAVYFDQDADGDITTSLTALNAIKLPSTGTKYPDTTYWESRGLTSRAETISYWLAADPENDGQYILYRRVNDEDSTIVSTGIMLKSGESLFSYYRLDDDGDPVAISPSSLPLVHTAKIHGSPQDTAASAMTDQIRKVVVNLYGTMTDPDTHQPVTRHLRGEVRLLNAGLVRHPTCGEQPIGATLTATADTSGTFVTLTWDASTDEATGEKDVERYLIFRRPADQANYGDAIMDVAAGLSQYTKIDSNVQPGEHWIYGLVAEDCTPSSSSVSESDPGPIPNPPPPSLPSP
jgi:prepilin-type N-terminal cleavage/methylation domain-containing protein